MPTIHPFASLSLQIGRKKPSTVPSHPPSSTAMPSYTLPQYFVDLGWDAFTKDTNAIPTQLIQLVALPSKQLAKACKQKESRNIEYGLLIIHDLIWTYLKHAEQIALDTHSSLHVALTAG
jgi:hypothetical protein